MRKANITLRVWIDGKVTSKLRFPRVIKKDKDGEYVLLYGRKSVVRHSGCPTVDVHRESAMANNFNILYGVGGFPGN